MKACKKERKNKLIGLTLGVLFISCMFLTTNKVKAATTITSTLNFRTNITTSQSNADQGWSWNADTKTLTLTNFNCRVATQNKACLLFPSESDITIILNGNNVIDTAGSASIGVMDVGTTQINSILIKGSGSLSIDTMNATTDGAIRTKNLTLESGKLELKTPIKVKEELKIIGGELSAKLFDKMDTVTAINVGKKLTISGGTIDVESEKPFQVTGDPDQDSVAVEITGGNITLKGEYDMNVGTIHVASGRLSHKADIVITGGNINCSDAGYCFSTESGDISINTGKAKINASHMKYTVENGGIANTSSGKINIYVQKDPADLTELNKAIAEAEALNEDEYEDFSAVTTALAKAKKLLENIEELTTDDQEKVDELVEEINSAIKALKKIVLGTTGKGDSSNTISTNPKTYDGIITYFILGGASLITIAGIGIYLRKKKLFD